MVVVCGQQTVQGARARVDTFPDGGPAFDVGPRCTQRTMGLTLIPGQQKEKAVDAASANSIRSALRNLEHLNECCSHSSVCPPCLLTPADSPFQRHSVQVQPGRLRSALKFRVYALDKITERHLDDFISSDGPG